MEFLHNHPEELKEAIDLVVYKTGISPEAVEKDASIYCCQRWNIVVKMLSCHQTFF